MSKPLDRLTLLETLSRIVERGSISAAARDLGISQASASRQLKDLEDRFGAQLVRRTTHSLSLTAAGEDLLRDARALLAGWNSLEERHGSRDGAAKGKLTVVAPVAMGQMQLADIALAFQADNPAVSLIWRLEDAPIRFAEIGCDCWIKVGSVPDDTLVVRPLGTVERLAVGSPDLVLGSTIDGPNEMAKKLSAIALSPFYDDRLELHDSAGTIQVVRPRTRLSTNNIFAAHRAVLRGLGYAVLPRWFVAADLAAGRLVDVLPRWRAKRLTINLAYLPSPYRPMRLTRFIEALKAGVPRIAGIDPPA